MSQDIFNRFQETLRRRQEERDYRMNERKNVNVAHNENDNGGDESDTDTEFDVDEKIDLRSRLMNLLADFEMDQDLNTHALTKRYVDKALQRSMRKMEKLIHRQTLEIQSMQEDQTVVTCLMVVMTLFLVLYMVIQTFQNPIRRFFSSVRGLNRLVDALNISDENMTTSLHMQVPIPTTSSTSESPVATTEEERIIQAAMQELERSSN